MAYSIVAHTGAGSTDGNSITTSAIDTTGATLLTVGVADYDAVTIGTVSDSKGNTWTPRTTRNNAAGSRVCLYDCVPGGNVGSGHTFTYTVTGGLPVICVIAASGGSGSPFDAETGAAQATGTTITPGSLTPAEANEILISMFMSNDSNAGVSVDSGFTVSDFANRVVGQHFEGAMAYLIETTATAQNPSWSVPDSTYSAVALAAYKVAAAGGATLHTLSLLGAG